MLCCKKKSDEPSLYQKLWMTFIRPHRSVYNLRDLGPSAFEVEGKRVSRTDFELKNVRGQTIKASFFHIETPNASKTCALYAHTHSGSRLESIGILIPAINNGVHLLAIDMTGSGLSDGEYVSFGIYERDDIVAAVKYLKEVVHMEKIILWGRSMGAVTLIQYASIYQDNSMCLVLDSPFANLKRLCKEVGRKRGKVPKFVTGMFLPILRSSIKKRGQFSINDLDIIKFAQKVTIPTFFIASKDDIFVSHLHSVDLCQAIKCPQKEVIYCTGGHNDSRNRDFLKSIMEKAKSHVSPNEGANVQEHDAFLPNKGPNHFEIHQNNNVAQPQMHHQQAQNRQNAYNIGRIN